MGGYKGKQSKYNDTFDSAMSQLPGATKAKTVVDKPTKKVAVVKPKEEVAVVKETNYVPAHIQERRRKAAMDGNTSSLAKGK